MRIAAATLIAVATAARIDVAHHEPRGADAAVCDLGAVVVQLDIIATMLTQDPQVEVVVSVRQALRNVRRVLDSIAEKHLAASIFMSQWTAGIEEDMCDAQLALSGNWSDWRSIAESLPEKRDIYWCTHEITALLSRTRPVLRLQALPLMRFAVDRRVCAADLLQHMLPVYPSLRERLAQLGEPWNTMWASVGRMPPEFCMAPVVKGWRRSVMNRLGGGFPQLRGQDAAGSAPPKCSLEAARGELMHLATTIHEGATHDLVLRVRDACESIHEMATVSAWRLCRKDGGGNFDASWLRLMKNAAASISYEIASIWETWDVFARGSGRRRLGECIRFMFHEWNTLRVADGWRRVLEAEQSVSVASALALHLIRRLLRVDPEGMKSFARACAEADHSPAHWTGLAAEVHEGGAQTTASPLAPEGEVATKPKPPSARVSDRGSLAADWGSSVPEWTTIRDSLGSDIDLSIPGAARVSDPGSPSADLNSVVSELGTSPDSPGNDVELLIPRAARVSNPGWPTAESGGAVPELGTSPDSTIGSLPEAVQGSDRASLAMDWSIAALEPWTSLDSGTDADLLLAKVTRSQDRGLSAAGLEDAASGPGVSLGPSATSMDTWLPEASAAETAERPLGEHPAPENCCLLTARFEMSQGAGAGGAVLASIFGAMHSVGALLLASLRTGGAGCQSMMHDATGMAINVSTTLQAKSDLLQAALAGPRYPCGRRIIRVWQLHVAERISAMGTVASWAKQRRCAEEVVVGLAEVDPVLMLEVVAERLDKRGSERDADSCLRQEVSAVPGTGPAASVAHQRQQYLHQPMAPQVPGLHRQQQPEESTRRLQLQVARRPPQQEHSRPYSSGFAEEQPAHHVQPNLEWHGQQQAPGREWQLSPETRDTPWQAQDQRSWQPQRSSPEQQPQRQQPKPQQLQQVQLEQFTQSALEEDENLRLVSPDFPLELPFVSQAPLLEEQLLLDLEPLHVFRQYPSETVIPYEV